MRGQSCQSRPRSRAFLHPIVGQLWCSTWSIRPADYWAPVGLSSGRVSQLSGLVPAREICRRDVCGHTPFTSKDRGSGHDAFSSSKHSLGNPVLSSDFLVFLLLLFQAASIHRPRNPSWPPFSMAPEPELDTAVTGCGVSQKPIRNWLLDQLKVLPMAKAGTV